MLKSANSNGQPVNRPSSLQVAQYTTAHPQLAHPLSSERCDYSIEGLYMTVYAIIGGSGLADLEDLRNRKSISINTPYGEPSGDIYIGDYGGR